MIILGINEFSITLARKYSHNYDIVIIKRDESIDELEIDAIIAPMDTDITGTLLKDSIFMALTENEEYNLFASSLAGEYGARKTIAFVYNPDYLSLSSADYIISPRQILYDRINCMIKEIKLRNISNLIHGKINVIEYTLEKGDPCVHKKAKDIELKDGMIFSINRSNKTILPNEDIELLAGDRLYILYRKGMFSNIFKQLFASGRIRKKVFIIGGNEILAENLKNIYSSVIIIETDISICHRLARKSEGIIILNGKGTEKNLLLNEGIDENSIFLAVDRDDYHNLLSSYQARSLGCNNIITVLNSEKNMEIAEILGLSNVISFPQLVTEHLSSCLKTASLDNKYFLFQDFFAAKIRIKADSSVVYHKIRKLNNNADFLIGVILRGRQLIFPDQDELIMPGDELLIFFYKNMEKRIYNIFC